jgi:pyridoxamine 5'-phosphate oxidase
MKKKIEEAPAVPAFEEIEDPVGPDPIARFHSWMEKAKECGLREPTAVALATVSPDGRPSVRMMLLKGADERGFVFYTNLNSRKGEELAATPRAALCFYWMPLGRQVRVEGRVEPVSAEEADEYFASRPRLSQLGAWASNQSKPMGGYFQLEQNVGRMALRFGLGKVPRPPFWSGFRLVAETIESWKEKPFRRHERMLYSRNGNTWTTEWLFP